MSHFTYEITLNLHACRGKELCRIWHDMRHELFIYVTWHESRTQYIYSTGVTHEIIHKSAVSDMTCVTNCLHMWHDTSHEQYIHTSDRHHNYMYINILCDACRINVYCSWRMSWHIYKNVTWPISTCEREQCIYIRQASHTCEWGICLACRAHTYNRSLYKYMYTIMCIYIYKYTYVIIVTEGRANEIYLACRAHTYNRSLYKYIYIQLCVYIYINIHM